MTRLSVNINKVATLRNARGGNVPDVIQFAKDCEAYGAQGITVHPRPDERHIRYDDVIELKKVVKTEFNIEGYPNDKFMELVLSVKPEQVTLVPDPPGVLTSNTGWDTVRNKDLLIDVVGTLKNAGCRVSIFLNPEPGLIESASQTGADRIELYTEPYAANYSKNREVAIAPYIATAKRAVEAGLGVNAGHDLNLENLNYLHRNLPGLQEVSIGHALIADALYYGIQDTIRRYLELLK